MTDQDTLNRLVFIKYLHTLAQQQAAQPEPLNATAILTLHDSVDLFLQLAAEHHATKKPDGTFLGYWDTIKDHHGNPPTQRPAMERLNRARVNLKHAGIRPARDDVNGLASATTLFLSENTSTYFTTTFEDIGFHHLITHPQAQELLRNAATTRANNQPAETVLNLALAFHWLVDDYRDNQQPHRRSPQGTRFRLDTRYRDAFKELTDGQRPRLAALIDQLATMVREMYDSHTILSLGLNYREYTRFTTLTPHVTRTTATSPELRYRVDIPMDLTTYPYTDEELEFCTTFVITTALTLTTPQGRAPTP